MKSLSSWTGPLVWVWQGAPEAGGRLIGGAGAGAPAGRPEADLLKRCSKTMLERTGVKF